MPPVGEDRLPVDPVYLPRARHEQPPALYHVGVEIDRCGRRKELGKLRVDLENRPAVEVCRSLFTVDPLESTRHERAGDLPQSGN